MDKFKISGNLHKIQPWVLSAKHLPSESNLTNETLTLDVAGLTLICDQLYEERKTQNTLHRETQIPETIWSQFNPSVCQWDAGGRSGGQAGAQVGWTAVGGGGEVVGL